MSEWTGTEWLTTGELAESFGVDAYVLREALETLALAEGGAPSPMALRHGLAEASTEEAGRSSFLWHRDVASIVRDAIEGSADGEDRTQTEDLGVTPEPSEFQAELFADAEPADAEAGEEPGNSSQARIGTMRPGFDAIVATDGACSGNPGPGGWAWVEQIGGARGSGGAVRTTNNVMELTALAEALEHVGPEGDLLVRIDSQYVINVMTKWAPAWRGKGWRKADGKPVANRELVERLLDLYEARTGRTEVEWVRGHSGDAANELVDALAVAEARTMAEARNRRSAP